MSENHPRLFAFAVLAVVLLLVYQNLMGRLSPLHALSVPLTYVNQSINTISTTVRDSLRMISAQEREIKRLRDELRTIKLKESLITETELENQRLRELLQIRENRPDIIAIAKVISRGSDKWASTFVIDKGSDHGLKKDMSVITPDGLLGKVHKVSLSFSEVLLIDDTRFSAAARLQSDRSETVVSGMGLGRMRLKYVNADTSPLLNDIIVTSGMDFLFPAGIKVGRILSVAPLQEGLFHEIEVASAVNPNIVEEVIILKR